jgi:hypothetical protein
MPNKTHNAAEEISNKTKRSFHFSLVKYSLHFALASRQHGS